MFSNLISSSFHLHVICISRCDSHLIHPRGQGVHYERGDLLHHVVWLPRVQDARETPHLRPWAVLVLLVVVVHDARLPLSVRRLVAGHGCVEHALRLAAKRSEKNQIGARIQPNQAQSESRLPSKEAWRSIGNGIKHGIIAVCNMWFVVLPNALGRMKSAHEWSQIKHNQGAVLLAKRNEGSLELASSTVSWPCGTCATASSALGRPWE